MTRTGALLTGLAMLAACQPADDEGSIESGLSSFIVSQIRNPTSGKCLAARTDASHGLTSNGTTYEALGCAQATTFSFEPMADGFYRIHPATTPGLCLGMLGAQTGNHVAVVQWACNTSWDQELDLHAVAGGYSLVDHLSHRCVDLTGYGTADGTPVQQFDCTGAWNQTFTLPQAAPNGSTGGAGSSPLGPGTSYYVDASAGSDANAGSASKPWKTLTKVNATSLSPGDNVLFRAGQTFGGTLTPRASGSAAGYVTFGSYGAGSRPTLSGGAADHVVDSNGTSYLVVQDLLVVGSAKEGVHIEDGAHIIVRNLDLQSTCGGIQAWFTSDVWVENNVVRTGCAEAIWAYQVTGGFHVIGNRTYPMTGATTDGMQIDYTPSYEVRCNYVDQGHQAGQEKGDLTITRSNRGLVRDNVFVGANYGVGMVGLAEGGPASSTVTNNHFIDNQNIQSWAAGVKFDDNPAEVWVPAGSPAFVPGGPTSMTITNNLIESDHYGVYVYDIDATHDSLTVTGNVANGTTTPFQLDERGVSGQIANNTANAASPLGTTTCPGGGMPRP